MNTMGFGAVIIGATLHLVTFLGGRKSLPVPPTNLFQTAKRGEFTVLKKERT